MTDEIKPDGYCAWHPLCGLVLDTAANSENAAHGNMLRSIGVNWGDDPVLSVLPPHDWQIKPVYLLTESQMRRMEALEKWAKEQRQGLSNLKEFFEARGEDLNVKDVIRITKAYDALPPKEPK